MTKNESAILQYNVEVITNPFANITLNISKDFQYMSYNINTNIHLSPYYCSQSPQLAIKEVIEKEKREKCAYKGCIAENHN